MSYKPILKYFNDLKYKRILIKNIYMLLLFSLLPLIIIIFISYSYYSSMLKNELVLKYSQSVSLVKSTMKITFDNSLYQIRTLLSDSSIQNLMMSKSFDELGIDNYKTLIKNISLNELTYDYTDSMSIYSSNIGLITGSTLIQDDSLALNPCVLKFKQLFIENNTEYSSFYTFSWQKRTLYGDKNILTVTRPFVSTQTPAGAVYVNIDIQKLLDPVIKDYFTFNGIFVMKSEGNTIYKYPKNIALSDENIDLVLAVVDKNKNFEVKDINKESWMLIPGNIDETDMTFYFILSYSEIANKLFVLKIALTFMVLAYLVIIIILSFYISNKMYNPVDSLLKTIKNYPSVLDGSKIVAKDEFAYISNTFNNMVQHHVSLEHKLEDRVKAFRKAQLIALQSQINPHFLCNTLDNINWMAVLKLGDENEISKMVGILSKLLRVSLESSQSVHSLEKEVEYSQQYLEIMKKRYADRFSVTWTLVNEIKNVEIPKITLQPIIENALHHGIKPLKSKGILQIGTILNNDTIYIEVSDNGKGFTDEEIELKNRELQNNYIKEDSSIGIANVNLRIKLLFGEQYGVIIGRSELGGVRVLLSLPVKT